MKPKGMQGQYAGFASRAVALVIDIVLITVTITVVNWFVGAIMRLLLVDPAECVAKIEHGVSPGPLCIVQIVTLVSITVIFPSLYLMFFWLFGAGSTPGHAIMGLRIVRTDGRPMRLHVVVRRWLGYIACFLSLGLGFLWVLIDNQRQGWHDTFAGTCVVYSWGVEPNETTLQRLRARLYPKVHSANISPPLPVLPPEPAEPESVHTDAV